MSVIWLIVTSTIFYGWFCPKFVLLLAASIFVNAWLGNTLIRSPNRNMLICGIAFNLGLIVFLKYSQFIADNFTWLLNKPALNLNIILQLAISFFTFQQIAFIVDCYQGKVKNCQFFTIAFLLFFSPQLIAGPIVQHH